MGRKKKSRASTAEEDKIEMDNDGRSSEKSLYEVFSDLLLNLILSAMPAFTFLGKFLTLINFMS